MSPSTRRRNAPFYPQTHMENFLSARPTIAKLSIPPKTTANLFASLANRTAHRAHADPGVEHPASQPPVEHLLHQHETQVELVRENGAVQRIVVVCKCGERIELDCVY